MGGDIIGVYITTLEVKKKVVNKYLFISERKRKKTELMRAQQRYNDLLSVREHNRHRI